MSLNILFCIAFLVTLASSFPQIYNDYQDDEYQSNKKYVEHEDDYGPAKYEFKYEVHDEHTGDIKSQYEHRDGDKVQGEYSLIDADGYQRIVKYSDDGHGFNAVLHREPSKYQIPQNSHYSAVKDIPNISEHDGHHSQVTFSGHGSSYSY
jgi:hypothetical protein